MLHPRRIRIERSRFQFHQSGIPEVIRAVHQSTNGSCFPPPINSRTRRRWSPGVAVPWPEHRIFGPKCTTAKSDRCNMKTSNRRYGSKVTHWGFSAQSPRPRRGAELRRGNAPVSNPFPHHIRQSPPPPRTSST
jgi:hypothetical protein